MWLFPIAICHVDFFYFYFSYHATLFLKYYNFTSITIRVTISTGITPFLFKTVNQTIFFILSNFFLDELRMFGFCFYKNDRIS